MTKFHAARSTPTNTLPPGGRTKRATTVLAAALLSFVALAAPGLGATFTVDSTRDDGPDFNPGNGVCEGQAGLFTRCTLRAAITEANALPGLDTIVVPAGTYNLDFVFGQHDITDDLILEGAGARQTILQGSSNHRILEVDTGVVAIVTDLMITGARVNTITASGNWGGGIKSVGILTLNRVWFHDNWASGGCGALGLRGAATVSNSLFTSNRSTEDDAGALCVSSGGQVSVTNSTFVGNTALRRGGAISSTPGPEGSLRIANSTLVDNNSGTSGSSVLYAATGSLHLDLNVIVGSCDIHSSLPKTSDGGNHQSPSSGCIFGGPGNLGNLDRSLLDLGSLGDYGGPLPTMMIGSNSLAMDPPGNNVSFCFPDDARGMPRQGLCDAGAVERQPADPETGPIFLDRFESGDTLAWSDAIP